MCSINGFNFPNIELAKKMSFYSESRGPDKSKCLVVNDFTFSFNLLAISSLDIENSIQPLINNKYAMLFNGEIYNCTDICKKYNIENKFKTDTEFLFNFINIYNLEKIHELEGMFSISIYDIQTEKLFLIRDRFGTKPLYYYFNKKNFIFSSHINSLFLNYNFQKEINHIALQSYLRFGYSIGSQSFFKNVSKVNPGEIIIFDNKIKSIDKSYLKKNIDKFPLNYKNFSKNISKSFIAESPVGLLLSGGLDSNILLHEYLHYKSNKNIHSFSTYFLNADIKYNEDSNLAKKVARDSRVNHHNFEIGFKKFKDSYEESYSVLYEPKLNKSVTIYYLMMEYLKKNNFKAIISGDGSDEMFLGYSKHIFLKKLILSLKNYDLKSFLNLRSYKGLAFLIKNLKYLIQKNPYGLFDLYQTQDNISLDKKTINYLKNYFKNTINNESVINSFIQYELMSWLVEDSLMIKDNLGMNFGVETRFPFLQHSILNLSQSYDITQKVDSTGKTLLRNLYKRKIPDYIFNKNKTGWEIPINWLQKKEIHSIKESKISNKKFVSLLNEHGYKIIPSRLNNIKYSNSLFSLSCWLDRNFF